MQIVLGVVIGLLIGSLAVWVFFASRAGASRAELAGARTQLEALVAERDALAAEREADRRAVAALEATNQSLRSAREEDKAQLQETIAALTNEVVAKGSERLTELAAERLELVTTSLEQNMALRDERFKHQVDPLRELLDRYTTSVGELELKREGAYREVTLHLEQLKESEALLQRETRSLVTALRSPQTRGNWGEVQLRRVVEMAGMVEHCDFDEQATVSTDEGLQRPDMTISLPEGGQIIVDAKVPFEAYSRSFDVEDVGQRKALLVDHARQLRAHVDSLSKKAYWKQFEPGSPDFVVCFVPGEAILSAAFDADHGLIDHAMANHVLLTGPVNLIALLKTVGLGWRQERLAKNAAEIQAAAHELYERLVTFASHLSKVGRSLNSSLNAYNEAIGSLERRVLPSARRFEQLGVTSQSSQLLESPLPVDGAVRRIEAPELGQPSEHPAAGHAELHLVEGDEGPLDD